MGNVDLFHSRRTNYHKCKYWVRVNGSPQQWVLRNQSNGTFYAKPLTSKNNQMKVINGVWATDSDHITLESDDHIDDIKRGCVVEFDNKLWLVENVQYSIHNKESEFAKNIDYKYIIALTRS